jgi:hypothetical protein
MMPHNLVGYNWVLYYVWIYTPRSYSAGPGIGARWNAALGTKAGHEEVRFDSAPTVHVRSTSSFMDARKGGESMACYDLLAKT